MPYWRKPPEAEGVGPLLYWKLTRTDAGELAPSTHVPGLHNVRAEAALALKTSYYRTAAQNAVLFQELDRILAALNEANTCPESAVKVKSEKRSKKHLKKATRIQNLPDREISRQAKKTDMSTEKGSIELVDVG